MDNWMMILIVIVIIGIVVGVYFYYDQIADFFKSIFGGKDDGLSKSLL